MLNATGFVELIIRRGAVFQHVNWQAEAVMEVEQCLAEGAGNDRPSDGRPRHVVGRRAKGGADQVRVRLDVMRRVMVQPEPVNGSGDLRKVARLQLWLDRIGQMRRIAGKMLWMRKGFVPVFREPLCRGGIIGARARRKAWLAIVDGAERGMDGNAMTEIDVMNGPVQGGLVGDARRVPVAVTMRDKRCIIGRGRRVERPASCRRC
jgi:hypothetical protein